MACVCGPNFAGLLVFMGKSVHLECGQKQPPNWHGHRQFGREQRARMPLLLVIELQSDCRGRETRKKKAKSKTAPLKPKGCGTPISLAAKGLPPARSNGVQRPPGSPVRDAA